MDDTPVDSRRYTKRQAGELVASSLDGVLRDPLGGARAKKRKTRCV